MARAFDPARLVQARYLSRLTKTELHRRVGVSAAAIGQYERGEVTPRADTIAVLARELDIPPGFFTHGRRRALVDIAQASFRRLRATSVAQQHQAVSYVEQVWELSSYLEESVKFPPLDLPGWAVADESHNDRAPDPVTAARAIREHWGLGSDPISFLVYELEQHGILTVLFSLKEEENIDEKSHIDAFSTTALPRPTIVLTPDKANDVMRHRFSAAHELGHIVLHHGRHPTYQGELRPVAQSKSPSLAPKHPPGILPSSSRTGPPPKTPSRLEIRRIELLTARTTRPRTGLA